jgi:hypothetical protein
MPEKRRCSMKIDKKYHNIVLACFAAFIISIPISFVMAAINYGFREGFFMAFLKSAFISVLISIPLSNFGVPLAKRIADRLTGK